ncbi:MAG: hypothetical protein JNK26_00295 [Candidatus Doudnabacteria bacterium]|nr:hypothetical protein [Candidatus Doudnabacteria bacterium]
MSKLETISFNFGTNILKVQTTSRVGVKLWQEIYDEVEEIVHTYKGLFDLNNTESTIIRFRQQPLEVPLKIPSAFSQYLKLSIQIAKNNELTANKDLALLSEAQLDISETTVTKHQELRLVPVLAPILLVEEVRSVLDKNGLEDYLLTLDKHFIAKGANPWRVALMHPTTHEELALELKDNYLSLEIKTLKLDPSATKEATDLLHNPFATHKPGPEILGIIISGEKPLDTYILLQELIAFDHILPLRQRLEKTNVHLWIIKSDETIGEIGE